VRKGKKGRDGYRGRGGGETLREESNVRAGPGTDHKKEGNLLPSRGKWGVGNRGKREALVIVSSPFEL